MLRWLPLAWLLLTPAYALEMAGTEIPERVVVDGAAQALTLAGSTTTHRQYMPFYGLALHLPEPRPQRAVLVQGLATCRITLVWFAHGLRAEEVRDYFRARFASGADDEVLTRIQPRVEQMLAMMQGAERGQTMTFDYDPDRGMVLEVEGGARVALPGVEFNRRLLGLWLGEAADEEVRAALLAQTH